VRQRPNRLQFEGGSRAIAFDACTLHAGFPATNSHIALADQYSALRRKVVKGFAIRQLPDQQQKNTTRTTTYPVKVTSRQAAHLYLCVCAEKQPEETIPRTH
jgi:hypothetical protein